MTTPATPEFRAMWSVIIDASRRFVQENQALDVAFRTGTLGKFIEDKSDDGTDDDSDDVSGSDGPAGS